MIVLFVLVYLFTGVKCSVYIYVLFEACKCDVSKDAMYLWSLNIVCFFRLSVYALYALYEAAEILKMLFVSPSTIVSIRLLAPLYCY